MPICQRKQGHRFLPDETSHGFDTLRGQRRGLGLQRVSVLFEFPGMQFSSPVLSICIKRTKKPVVKRNPYSIILN